MLVSMMCIECGAYSLGSTELMSPNVHCDRCGAPTVAVGIISDNNPNVIDVEVEPNAKLIDDDLGIELS